MADYDDSFGKMRQAPAAPHGSFKDQYKAHRNVAEMTNRYQEAGCMFDSLTALPSFDLFEDRLQTAINNEMNKDIRLKKNRIAVAGVYLDNLAMFGEEEIRHMLLRKTGEKLTAALPANFTVARGINYHFWIMMPNMPGEQEINLEVSKIQNVILQPISDNFAQYRLLCSIGISVFHGREITAKNLVEEAIVSLQKAQSDGENKIVYFSEN